MKLKLGKLNKKSSLLLTLLPFGILMFLIYIKRKYLTQVIQSKISTNFINMIGVPRGIRNNNPLNIRDNAQFWQGEIGENKDPGYEEFVSMAFGCRAGLKLLKNYVSQGNDNLYKIINKWAPATDGNSPASYISIVKRVLKEKFGMTVLNSWCPVDKNGFTKLAYAMSCVEVGEKYAPSLIIWEDGWSKL